MPPPARCVPRQAWRNGSTLFGERTLAEEVPVAFSYGGATHAVLMATPDDLEDFALGFSYTEGIITAAAEIVEMSVVGVADGIVLRMWLTGDRSDAFAARHRRFVGPAGCGMCGLESLAEANRAIPTVSYELQVSRQDIAEAVAALPARQQLNMQTRAVHAAAFWRPDQSLVLREDVGRHNALDKLAGALLRKSWSAAEGVIVLSSTDLHRARAKSSHDAGGHHSGGVCADGFGRPHRRGDRPHACRHRPRRRVRGVHPSRTDHTILVRK